MTPAQDYAKAHEADAGGIFRLVGIAFRRYARDPDTRQTSARLMLINALALYASLTSVGDAAVTASEMVASLAQQERRAGQ